MDYVPSYKDLKEEYVRTKTQLDKTEKALKNFPGFNPNRQRKFDAFSNRDLSALSAQNHIKKLKKDDFSKPEESPEEYDDLPKKSVLSTVVAKNVRNFSSKREVIRNQNVTLKVKLRNRRILGMLQGTLLKFQDEAKKRESQETKRFIVEGKVEAAVREEKEEAKRKREEIFHSRKKKQLQLRCLKEMMDRTQLYEEWENNQKYLSNFIVTKAEPAICFMPSSHTSRSRIRHEKSKANILESIERRKMQLMEELANIKESYMPEYCEAKTTDTSCAVPESSAGTKFDVLHEEETNSELSFTFHADEDDELCLV